eukprot:SAG31_NODE_2_length_46263_cov_45.908043_17_plen_61_part_00
MLATIVFVCTLRAHCDAPLSNVSTTQTFLCGAERTVCMCTIRKNIRVYSAQAKELVKLHP